MDAALRGLYMDGCQLMYRVFPKYQIDRNIAGKVSEIYKKGSHVFRGYYDINFFNNDRDKFLVHILPKEQEDGNNISIGYYDLKQNKLAEICQSNAWCWQQGSRLRWFDDSNVMFNDCVEGRYVSRVVDVQTGNTAGMFSRPLYDVCLKRGYGLSLNFSRLQRIRPGYGYRTLEDTTVGHVASAEDGIYRHILKTDRSDLIISLQKLHSIVRPEFAGEDYINHICISPEGDKFMFFYIVCDADSISTKVYLMCSSEDGSGVTLLESGVQPSHYTWADNEHILITFWDRADRNKQGYRLYDTKSCSWEDYGAGVLALDGHPTFINQNRIVSDTYPERRKFNNQYLFLYDDNDKNRRIIGRFFQDIRYSGERRCDLHPSLSGKTVSVDTNCYGLRRVILMDLHENVLLN